MRNDKFLLVYDYETSGRDPRKVGITQIAGVIIHPQTLEILDEFNRDNIKPRETDLIEDEAFKITRKNKDEILKNGHDPKIIWPEWVNFIKQYNPKMSGFMAPIPCGFNIDGYDSVLTERYAEEYGPWDTKKDQQCLMSNFMSFDVMRMNFWWHRNNHDLADLKLDTYRDYVGMSKANAHDALQDVKDTAAIIVKYLRLYSELGKKIRWKGAFGQ